jgi:hypothetical protein
MEVVQTINKEISSVANNTAAVVSFSKNFFSYFTKTEQVFFYSKGFTQFQRF